MFSQVCTNREMSLIERDAIAQGLAGFFTFLNVESLN